MFASVAILSIKCLTRHSLSQIGFFSTQIEKSEIAVRPSAGDVSAARARSTQEIDDLEEKLNEHERRITQMNNSHETLQRRYLELTEAKHVLRETDVFFQMVGYMAWINDPFTVCII
jgi:V-type H+-transporting ATPase subunit a